MNDMNYAGLPFTEINGVFVPNLAGFRSYGAFFQSGLLVPNTVPLTFGEKTIRYAPSLILTGCLTIPTLGCHTASGDLRYDETNPSHAVVGATIGNDDFTAGRARVHMVASPTENSGIALDGQADYFRQQENGNVSSGSGRIILSPYPLVAAPTLRLSPSLRFGGGIDKRADSERETLPTGRYTLSSGAGLDLDILDDSKKRLTRATLFLDYNLGRIGYDLRRNGHGDLRGDHDSISAALRVQQRLGHPDIYGVMGSSVLLGNKDTDGTFHARSGPLAIGMEQNTLSYEATGGALVIPARYSNGWPLLFAQAEGGYGRNESATTLTQSKRTSSSRDANGQAILRGRLGVNVSPTDRYALFLFLEAEHDFGLNGASNAWRISGGLDLSGILFTNEKGRGQTLDSLLD